MRNVNLVKYVSKKSILLLKTLYLKLAVFFGFSHFIRKILKKRTFFHNIINCQYENENEKTTRNKIKKD